MKLSMCMTIVAANMKEKLESYLKKWQYIRHCLLQSEQSQLDMPERRGTAYHRRTCHPV